MRKKILTWTLAVLAAAGLTFVSGNTVSYAGQPEPVIPAEEVKNLEEAKDTDQLILVEAVSLYQVKVSYYRQTGAGAGPGVEKAWEEQFTAEGVYGRNGATDQKTEGDGKTPLGTYQFTMAFGLKEDPGSILPYHQIVRGDYWVDDPDSVYYNKLVNTSETAKSWNSAEDMASAAPFYNYGLVLNYNTDCVPGKGSAIFMHCTESEADTGSAGCIRIPESRMQQLLKSVDEKTKIMIISDHSQ